MSQRNNYAFNTFSKLIVTGIDSCNSFCIVLLTYFNILCHSFDATVEPI